MDMEIIDTVRADTLAAGDTIGYEGSLEEILSVEDGEELILFLEDSGEISIHPDLMVNIYGYTEE